MDDVTSQPSRLPRKRGGQPRNKNALRHGIYARHFDETRRRGLQDMPTLDVVAEIHLLRHGLEIVLTLIEQCDDEDRKIKLLNSLFNGSQRLITALRTQAQLTGGDNELLSDFWDALALYQHDKGLA